MLMVGVSFFLGGGVVVGWFGIFCVCVFFVCVVLFCFSSLVLCVFWLIGWFVVVLSCGN